MFPSNGFVGAQHARATRRVFVRARPQVRAERHAAQLCTAAAQPERSHSIKNIYIFISLLQGWTRKKIER